MIFMCNRSSEERHYAISGELIYGSLIFVNFIHQNVKTAVHNLVDNFRIQLFSHGSIIGDIGKQHRYKFAFAFNRTAGGKDFIR